MTHTKIEIKSWSDLRNEVKKIPIEEIATLRESELEIEWRGYQPFGICPFHNDEEVGNFALGGPHNGFKCFACDATGDAIDLIMKLDNVGFKEALTIIATGVGIMTDSELNIFLTDGQLSSATRVDWGINLANKGPAKLTEEDIYNRNVVYSLLSEGRAIVNPISKDIGEAAENKLSNKHYYQLSQERKLSDREIKDAGFFSLDEEFNFIGPLNYRIVNELGLMPNTLNVPGFWRNSNGVSISTINKSDGTTIELDEDDKQYYWNFDPVNALGIPIKDEQGNIVAIQLRPDKVSPTSSKYIWFSSSSVTRYQKDKIEGSSPGAPMDVMYPDDWNTPHLFITEGKFKSLSIKKHLRSASISLQGINTYRGIGKVIANIDKSHSKKIKNIFIAFDGDMSFNDSVIKAVIDMTSKELTGYTIHVAVWDYLYGKGIDDLINNGHSKVLTRITVDELKEVYQLLNNTDITGKNKDEIKDIKENVFYKWLSKKKPSLKLHPSRIEI